MTWQTLWVLFLGALVTLNMVTAFSCRDRGPSRLAFWLGVSFAVSLAIELPRRIDPPWLMASLAALDGLITIMCATTARSHAEMRWTLWPMALINLMFISAHMIAVFYGDHLRLYLAALDVLFLVQLGINGRASMMNGIEIHRLFFLHRGGSHSVTRIRAAHR